MATVGDLYNRLVEFLNAVTPKQPEGEKPAEGGEATTEAPAESTKEPADEGSKGE